MYLENFQTLCDQLRSTCSLVWKVSNVQDRALHHVLTGMDAVREAVRLERRLHDFERDLWQY